MKIIITSDHAGYALKEKLIKHFKTKNIEYLDNGTKSAESVDYPDFAKSASELVLKNKKSKGVFICGTGIGMNIAANKTKGIRAALVCDTSRAKLAVEHNNANVICLGARFTRFTKAKKIVDVFIGSKFKQGRHIKRINKIEGR
jgi:ribose 5-phosphate isomerase B